MRILRKVWFGIMLAGFCQPAWSSILVVGPGQNYSRIQSALKAARPGDEIQVQAGSYAEGPLLINIPLTLSGVGRPVLDGKGLDQILTVKASGVTVRGFRLINSGASSMRDVAGMKFENLRHCQIFDNQLENTNFGIYLANVKDCQIRNNQVHGLAKSESSAGNAIHSWKSSRLQITNNVVSGHRDGIYLEFTRQSKMENNHSFQNLRYGMHFMFSDGNSYLHNLFEGNGAGVAVMYTHDIVMVGNRFLHNWGPSSYGLLLKEITKATIRENQFERNTIAMHLEGSSKLRVMHNTFVHNGWAARVLSNSFDNHFESNNFIGNAFDIASNASDNSQSINAFAHNYWDKYSGYDLGHDGTGDVPHHPVSLFSRVVENIPPALMLMRSFLVSTLDLAERVSPVLTPKTMVDEAPSMRQIL